MIEIRQVTKTYGMGETAVHALRGVSLNVAAGEYVAVMGSSTRSSAPRCPAAAAAISICAKRSSHSVSAA